VRLRKALAFALVLSVAILVPAEAGHAADSFRFFGSGWGHGLGMSQWGAYGLAKQGWGQGRILTHFYSGTKVAPAPSPPGKLRVGLVQGRAKVRLAPAGGPADLRLGDPKAGEVVATIPADEAWTVQVAGQAYRILDGSGKKIGEDVGGPGNNLYVVYGNGVRVVVPEAGHAYGRGFIELNLYNCLPGCRERLILVVGVEEYLYGLAEVPSSWPVPALQAQAIAARTYAFTKAATGGQNRVGCNCALYASSFDQVYAGWDKEAGLAGERWVAAVNATAGQVVMYQGQSIQAFYMSSSGGFTEDNENVWGGTPIPYLRGVCDPGDYTSANPNAVWDLSLPADRVTRRLGLGIGPVTGFTDTVRGVSGRIVTTVVQGASGTAEVSGSTLRSALGLPDDRVWVNANRQIIGSIREKYDATNCRPGLPTSPEAAVAGGTRQQFQRGAIYFKAGMGAHVLSGSVLEFYVKKGGPKGRLGFPTGDVETLKNGATRGTFEHGKITCTASGACRAN
jgi:stage II sporulation protein D